MDTYFSRVIAKSTKPHNEAASNPTALAAEEQAGAGQNNKTVNTSQRSCATQRFQSYNSKPPPIYTRWNSATCREAYCSFRHICLECHGNHKERRCLLARGGQLRENHEAEVATAKKAMAAQGDQHTWESQNTWAIVKYNNCCVN